VRHVFLETNWLIAIAAPAHNPPPAAAELLQQAQDGRIRIYIPACCIGEAKKTIRLKYQPKEADRLRRFVLQAVEQNMLDQNTAESARTMLTTFERHVTSELAGLTEKLRDIANSTGIEILPLDIAVLDMSLELYFKEIDLSEFDRAVLAAVLIKGRNLRDGGEADVNFCDLDSNLWPWEKRTRHVRPELKKLYDDAGVWVYSDFTLTTPERPEGFPQNIRG
jgi:rRNA-processing protein FCF1